MTFRHSGAPQYQIWLHKPKQICARALHPSPPKTPQCFPYSILAKIRPQTLLPQVIWFLGRSNGTSWNNYVAFSHVTPLYVTKPPLKKWLNEGSSDQKQEDQEILEEGLELSPEEMMSREVELCASFASISKLFVNSSATDIVFVTLSKHSNWNSNCAVHKSLGNGEGTPP